MVYLDKDTLIPLSKQIFAVAGQEYNRSSDFFEKNIRNYEYETILALGMEALTYDDIVLINAPFTREVRDKAYMSALRARLAEKGALLVVVWVVTDPEVCRARMQERNSSRDTWKLAHWAEYSSKLDFSIPSLLQDPGVTDRLLLFYNSSDAEYEASMKRILAELEETEEQA